MPGEECEPVGEESKTLARALALLNCFSRGEPVLNTSQIARRLGISRTATSRLLNTFARHRFVEPAPGGRGYQIGLGLFEIGALYLEANPAAQILLRALDELVERTGWTSYLGILDGSDTIILAYREGRHPVRFIFGIGDRLPSTTTALGKAVLACLPREELDRRLGTGELPVRTERSLRTRRELDAQLTEIRRRGWSLAEEESHPGLTAVGAAVLDARREPLAGISISFFNHVPDASLTEQFGAIVSEVARRVSERVAIGADYGPAVLPRLGLPGRHERMGGG
ncbi:MAG TPA: IclR family transcriptional regulator [Gemmatimonadales bacterium]